MTDLLDEHMPHDDPDSDDLANDSPHEDLPRAAGLEARIVTAIAPSLSGMGYELVRVAVLGRERPTVQIMADRADGAPISVSDCEAISQGIGAVLDVANIITGAWTLEASSPGIDRPLTRVKDWNRFAGHLARAEMAIPVEGRRRISGVALGHRRHVLLHNLHFVGHLPRSRFHANCPSSRREQNCTSKLCTGRLVCQLCLADGQLKSISSNL